MAGGKLLFVKDGATGSSIAGPASGAIRLVISSDVDIAAGTLSSSGSDSGSITFSGLISGAGSLNKNNTGGSFILSGANNTFTGGVRFTGGASLQLQATGAAGTGAITVGNGESNATLSFTTANDQTHTNAIVLGTTGTASSNRSTLSNSITGLVLSGDITRSATQTGGASVFRITGTGGTGTIEGDISNTNTNGMNLLKEGSGVWTLTGANSYTGTTTVSAGELATGTSGNFGMGAGFASNVIVTTGILTLGNAASIADTAMLTFTNSASTFIKLNFTGIELLGGIADANTSIASGIYSASALNDFFGGNVFSGTGSLAFGAIPEPSACALIFGGVGIAVVALRKHRRLQ